MVTPFAVYWYSSLVTDMGSVVNPLPSPTNEPLYDPVALLVLTNPLTDIVDPEFGMSTNVTVVPATL